LTGYPACDAEVNKLGEKLWGEGEEANKEAGEHSYGKGRIIWGRSVVAVLREKGVLPDFTSESSGLDYLHRSIPEADIYFVSNNVEEAAKADCTFRVSGRQPELWGPLNGHIRDGRGRDSDCSLPPARTRACAISAHGSCLGCADIWR
jgi:hypothetical protein